MNKIHTCIFFLLISIGLSGQCEEFLKVSADFQNKLIQSDKLHIKMAIKYFEALTSATPKKRIKWNIISPMGVWQFSILLSPE